MNYRETITGLPMMKRLGTLALMLGCLFSLQQGANSQDITKIWEFSPYEVEVWYSFAPETNISSAARDQFIQDVRLELARTFRASWRPCKHWELMSKILIRLWRILNWN